jgi:hypothetical protein
MPKTYSLNYLSSEFSIDRATAVRATKGIAPTEEKTKGRPTYSIAEFARALESHRAANASNNDSYSLDGADASPLMEARIRITTANAVARERENAISAGELVHIKHVANDLTISLRVLHSNLLVLPGKIADALSPHSPFDRGEIARKVALETYDFMDAIKKDFADIAKKFYTPPIEIKETTMNSDSDTTALRHQ